MATPGFHHLLDWIVTRNHIVWLSSTVVKVASIYSVSYSTSAIVYSSPSRHRLTAARYHVIATSYLLSLDILRILSMTTFLAVAHTTSYSV